MFFSSPLIDSELTEAFLITKEFQTCEEFSVYIQKEATQRNIPCMDMLLEYCEERNVEPVAVATLITSELKNNIQAEANLLHLLKPSKKGNR